MTSPIIPPGARIVGPPRAGVCGTWWRVQSPEGELGALRLATDGPGAAERLAATTGAVRALRHGGLLTTGDPVRHDGALWLVAGQPPGPTLSELSAAGAGGLALGGVATVAVETARTLTALHAAGHGHGAVHGRTVVLTGIGAVALTETGLLPALRGERADPATDRRAWAELVRWLVARWCGPEPGADLLLRCVTRGEQDLAGAVRQLRELTADLPTGVGDRSELRAAVAAHHRWSTTPDAPAVTAPADPFPTEAITVTELPTEAYPAAGLPTEAVTVHGLPTEAITVGGLPTEAITVGGLPTEAYPAAGLPTEAITVGETPTGTYPVGAVPTEALTVRNDPAGQPPTWPPLPTAAPTAPAGGPYGYPATPEPKTWAGVPTGTGRAYRSPEPTAAFTPTTADPAAGGFTSGRADRYAPTGSAPSAGSGGEVRFGPGVPTTPPTAPSWPRQPAASPPPRRSRWRLVGSILSSLLTLALLVVVGLHLWQRFSPLEINSVRVAVAEPPGTRCDVTVNVVATVETNGRAGSITYQWLRGGAEPGGLLTQRVGRGQRTVTLNLKWAFNGVGTTTETAVINITEPAPVQARTSFRYRCEPR